MCLTKTAHNITFEQQVLHGNYGEIQEILEVRRWLEADHCGFVKPQHTHGWHQKLQMGWVSMKDAVSILFEEYGCH